ncbi:pdm3 [Trypoxylus dichotomus]
MKEERKKTRWRIAQYRHRRLNATVERSRSVSRVVIKTLKCRKLKESDRESSCGSPEPATSMGVDESTDLHLSQQLLQQHHQQCNRAEEPQPYDQPQPPPPSTHHHHQQQQQQQHKMTPVVSAAAAAHLNGTMAGLVTLQNLQNLATLQQSLPQVATLAAGLQNIANNLAAAAAASTSNGGGGNGSGENGGNSPASAPLNLSVNATAPPRSTQLSSSTSSSPSSSASSTESPGGLLSTNLNHKIQQQQTQPSQQAPVPLPSQTTAAASGTSIPSLLASQQPAPMPQFILASGQLVQGIQGAQLLIPTSQGLATQTILTIPVNHVNSNDQMVNLALSNGQVITTTLANLQAMAQPNILPAANPTIPTTNGSIGPPLLNPPNLAHLMTGSAPQQLLQTIPQMMSNHHAPNQGPLLNALPQPVPSLLTTPPSTLLSTPSTQTTSNTSRSSLSINPLNPAGHYQETKMPPLSIRSSSPTTVPNVSNLSRLSATNGELTITTSHGPISSQNLKRSPSSLSPNCTDNSTADLLVDSPNQPTINQTSSNVVDGINLDEIKDFAKAFKLRRLSLGLTQTQVGQALSVTEGPAYSQSAICSALASQMFAAAQLSTQQQAMFEKLDITPKSAQKIKPVLERWMKEAEESFSRYKSGQNHLTDFIGIEPSKKRKRRTSFTPQALELLNAHFERNTHPSGTEITGLAHQLGYEREVIRIWFCNKRQALKNTVRMMSKGMV